MSKHLRTIGWLFFLLSAPATWAAIVPVPAEWERDEGAFTLTPQAVIYPASNDPECRRIADMLSDYLKEDTRLDLNVVTSEPGGSETQPIVLRLEPDPEANESAYQLLIEPKRISLRAAHPRGLFYAVQSLRQCLVKRGIANSRRSAWYADCGRMQDAPRYAWRGMLLDCSRHFMEKDFVKRYIDLLAYHKMNVLHWHLTDDQGWRIEIKKYPKLTEIGAWRNQDGERYGGYYTQEEIKEVVAYAAERFITVVPEIEMPGHSMAALAAYPELSCTGGPFEVPTTWGVFKDVYCVGNEQTFTFLTDVLSEVLELFPSKFIHIGGDEVPKDRWKECPKSQQRMKTENLKNEDELQSYFIRRINQYLTENGRRLIGWDEILEGGLAPNATVQSWRGMQPAIKAAKAGHDVVASPTTHCYLDYAQAQLPGEHDFGFLTLDQCYAFEPTPAELNAQEAKHILGLEGNLWSERAPQERVDWQVFPRLCALAEVAWSPKSRRNYEDFLKRMEKHYLRLDRLGVNYFFAPAHPEPTYSTFTRNARIQMVSPTGHGMIFFTRDGSDPDKTSEQYRSEVTLWDAVTLRTVTILPNGRRSAIGEWDVRKLPRINEVEPPRELRDGLIAKYYHGIWRSLPDFSALTPTGTATVTAIDTGLKLRDQHYAIMFEGFLAIPVDGRYTFHLTSDDGSRMWIGDELIIENDGLHSVREHRAEVDLRPGLHPIRVAYFQFRGPSELSLAVSGSDGVKRPIPEDAFFHSGD